MKKLRELAFTAPTTFERASMWWLRSEINLRQISLVNSNQLIFIKHFILEKKLIRYNLAVNKNHSYPKIILI